MTEFWMPILDTEIDAARRCFPGVNFVRRDDAWWMHTYSRAGNSKASMVELVQIMLQEEMGGSVVHHLKAN